MSAKSWAPFGPDEFSVPTAPEQPLIFMIPSCSEQTENPTWVTYPGEELPLVGRVMLAASEGQLLVQPPAGHLCCIKGGPVKLLPAAAESRKFREHTKQFRPSAHSTKEAIRIATSFLATNRRRAETPTNQFVEFTHCTERGCGYRVQPRMVLVREGEQPQENVSYTSPEVGDVIQQFLSENRGLCLGFH